MTNAATDRSAGHTDAPVSKRALVGWALFDWANSPFSTLIVTFVFARYFAAGIVGDDVDGQVLWSYAIGISGIFIAVLSPVLGAVADAGGRRKPWLALFTLLCAAASTMLWWAEPSRDFIVWAMIWVIVGNFAFEFGIVFNNAMLPDLVDGTRIGRWSGWAWGVGYLGGIVALVIALVALILTDAPWFGLDKERAEHIRAIGPLVAIWFLVFVWPMFLYTPDRPSRNLTLAEAISRGLRNFLATLRNVRQHANAARFLLAHMVYNDGLTVVFAIGAIFAAATFGMSEEQLIIFGIVLNVTAGCGAFGFAWLDDWVGPKLTITVALLGMLTMGIAALVITELTYFWVAAALFGIFMGPAQAASRSLMARLAPPQARTELFGLFAFSGKATAFVGTLIAGAVTAATASQRAGLATAVVFIAIGLVLLLGVREPGRGGDEMVIGAQGGTSRK